MASVGIRKLQQHASAVVDRAKAGEIIEITDHGRPVAQIGPLPTSRLEAMVEAGLLSKKPEPLTELPPLLPPIDPPATEVLAEMRDAERW